MEAGFNCIGFRIRTIRKQKKITTKQLSNDCGISEVYLRQIEGQGKLPSLSSFISICNALNIEPTYLLQDCLDFRPPQESNELIQQCQNLTPMERKKASALLRLVFSNDTVVE